jgi:hypothetical protein
VLSRARLSVSPVVPLAVFLSVLVVGGFAVLAESELRLPGNHKGYAPVQPVAFSHRLHAGELQLDCLFCHGGAETSRHAGVPPVELCMDCHRHVTAPRDAVLAEAAQAESEGREPRPVVSDEIAKLYAALGLGEDLLPDPGRTPRPVEWVRVHQLPDFTYFDHRVHVARGVACQQCHGPVQAMERVRQDSSLSMGWCVDCHRRTPADPDAPPAPARSGGRAARHVSTDCGVCHY